MKIFFYLIFAVIYSIIGSIIKLIKNFFISRKREIIGTLVVLSVVVPIVYSTQTDWEIPGLLILYIFFVVVIGFFALIAWAGNDGYDDDYRMDGKTYGKTYNGDYIAPTINTYTSPNSIEKRKNGGLTDKEVLDKKKLIRKKLEAKKLIERKEEVNSK